MHMTGTIITIFAGKTRMRPEKCDKRLKIYKRLGEKRSPNPLILSETGNTGSKLPFFCYCSYFSYVMCKVITKIKITRRVILAITAVFSKGH